MPVIVWYDGGCPLCQREIAIVRKLDWLGNIEFIDASRADLRRCPIKPDQLLARFHASEKGRLLSGAAAFGAMWRAVPLLWPLGLVARLPIALVVLERAYRLFLRCRPRLQKLTGSLVRQ